MEKKSGIFTGNFLAIFLFKDISAETFSIGLFVFLSPVSLLFRVSPRESLISFHGRFCWYPAWVGDWGSGDNSDWHQSELN